MKVLYVFRSLGHFSYHESVIKYLCANGDQVLALFDQRTSRHFSDGAVKNFQNKTPGFTWGWSIRRNDFWRRLLFSARELRSYANYLKPSEQSDYYLKRWEAYLPAFLKPLTRFEYFKRILASEQLSYRLEAFESWVGSCRSISDWLIRHGPDVVVASPMNLRFSEEVEYIKAANALGIPTAVPVLSWDNLTTKGIFHVVPDLTLAWNQAHFDSAVERHRIPPDRIVITGAPFFDKWLDVSKLAMGRKEFCQKVGLNPERPFVVYLGSSSNIASDETWLVHKLLTRLREHFDPVLGEMGVLIRPHPANAGIYQSCSFGGQATVWPIKGALPDSEESLQDFYNTLVHCVATIGINTSGMIDAVIVGKPCITIMTERYRPTQLQAVHFRDLLAADVLEVTHSIEDCVAAIERITREVDSRREERRRFVENFIRPHGFNRSAGEVVGRAIRLGALGRSAAQINSAIASGS